ncbi:transposable element Tc1 transposase [Trichonephila clavipes]|nr:transposable element Tc1 transposase [Trichonephila clavipes]
MMHFFCFLSRSERWQNVCHRSTVVNWRSAREREREREEEDLFLALCVSLFDFVSFDDSLRDKVDDVAREFDIAHSVVSRLWKSFKTTGMCSRRHGGGRVRTTTPAEDRYIALSAKRNRRTTAQQVANQFLAASGKPISRKTVARRF